MNDNTNIKRFMDYSVTTVSELGNEAVFALSPLPTGFGYTLGNVLRRVLLSSIKGAAISELRMDGVPHQFATVEGMKEDIIRFVLNIKKVRVRLHGDKPVVLKLEASGIKEVTAGDFTPNPSVEIINPNQYLASLTTKKAKVSAQVLVEPGYGYVAREALEQPKIGVLPVDSIFSPVVHVSYEVEETRVGETTDLNKLVLRIKTDGSISPREVLNEASSLLVSYFARISGQTVTDDKLPERVVVVSSSQEELALSDKDFGIPVEDLDLPLRTINSLKKSKINTLGDLISLSEEEILNIRGLGETSIKQINELIKKENWK